LSLIFAVFIVNIPVIYVCCFASVMRKQVSYHHSTQIMIRTEERSVLYLYTKFQADSYIRSKVIRGSKNFEIGLRQGSGVVCGRYSGGVRPLSRYQISSGYL